MRDYAEIAHNLRCCGVGVPCDDCTYQNDITKCASLEGQAADAIEELLAVCRDIAAFVIHYADDDEVSAEVLCRKLHKIGVVEKDGAWWALPETEEEERE